ncbi:MAG: hypothetical protein A3J48_00780 [Candidatus Doudnabacteria bacterium RIFCSPHIGHO2_02_FULL_46_11]|uniref:Uncharacterized protein n=1 Tax=Candidatus Doudnabacteria bacterium RIFCSPHIGHO2_02_FULL_46_11 TaxID=1817832 RepID=A0A1F5P8J6_9BACT|nr:MAG: hypothetical protein A3J48_00780 [Candidatus Doudnabacteria bacterium RIFCSPHIGHO2_02_FULL_46_11]
MRDKASQYAKSLHTALEEAGGANMHIILDEFVQILARRGQFGIYSKIEAELEKLFLKDAGIRQAELFLARDLSVSKPILEKIKELLGGKVEFVKKVDKNLIGGFWVLMGDTLIDGSVRGQLEELSNQLRS